ncbi:hypothetical protein N7510_000312 [Penicillium lagena]|uniref:uncharacterized protein n=1 Tax=Penicillium lagena TaxID=94218 RepID=UPI0025403CFD|nr:uncharacterized protein N7510_000312 [Penicillium lagena]KAJ5624003.1 hypothetical protein N7510_000312 [Penicillium lagena]
MAPEFLQSLSDGYEAEELRLKESGDDEAEDLGLAAEAVADVVEVLELAAAAAELHEVTNRVFVPRSISCTTLACKNSSPADAGDVLWVEINARHRLLSLNC